MNAPYILNFEQAAELLNVSSDIIKSIVESGDLPTIGTGKDLIKLCDINNFMGVNPAFIQNEARPIDFTGKQRYIPTHSILIENISESEWENVKKAGGKEHKPYWDSQKNRWCIALSMGKNEDGKRIRKIISAPTQAELWDAYREFVSQKKDEVAPISTDSKIVQDGEATAIGLTTFRPQQDVLVSTCFSEFLNGLEGSIDNRTYGSYISTGKHIIEALGHLKMYELNKKELQTFLNNQVKAKYISGGKESYFGQTHLNIVYDLLKRFVIEYSDEESGTPLLAKNYMIGIKKPKTKKVKKEEIMPLTDDEINMIFEAVKHDIMIACWVYIMAETGCRPSEALALKWSDIDFGNKTLSITKALGKEADYDPVSLKRTSTFRGVIKDLKNDDGKKHRVDHHSRKLKISDRTLSKIQEWHNAVMSNSKLLTARKGQGTDMYIFSGPKGNFWTYDDYSQRYERCLKKFNLNPSEMFPYRFRHTVCTYLMKKLDLKTVQLIMGDNTPDVVTQIYTNIDKESVLNSSTALSDRMEGL